MPIPGFAKPPGDANTPDPDQDGSRARGVSDDLSPVDLLPEWPFAAMRDLQREIDRLREHVANVHALIAHARNISPSDRMNIAVGDLEHALGLRDRPAGSRNDDSMEAGT